MLIQKRGRKPPVFKREQQLKAEGGLGPYDDEIAWLREITFEQLERLGIDPENSEQAVSFMAENAPSNNLHQTEGGLRKKAEQLLAQVMVNLMLTGDSENYDELTVFRLCQSFLYVGLVAGTPDFDSHYVCPTCIIKQHSKHNGKSGAKKRYAPLHELRVWAVEKYKMRSWPSASNAAYQLMKEVIAHGKTLGVSLKESNAQRTIAEWFRESD
ncbi:hypothetical protein [Herbaspirillum huttiense]|uniref:hypothetical protein n=1 Tax=Herbaspirillum huttiense TaxID=863372 RepID=UPI0039B01AEA